MSCFGSEKGNLKRMEIGRERGERDKEWERKEGGTGGLREGIAGRERERRKRRLRRKKLSWIRTRWPGETKSNKGFPSCGIS